MRCCVLMGVSGCGASSVGKALQVLCDIDIVDRDDLHPRASIGKMRSVSRLMIRIAPRGPRTSFAGWPTKTVPSPSVIPRSGNNTATGYRSTWTSRSTSRISTFLATCCRDGWHIGLGISYPLRCSTASSAHLSGWIRISGAAKSTSRDPMQRWSPDPKPMCGGQ